MSLTLADRLRARTQQLGLTPAQVAEMAGLNRSFIYDILRGRSGNPNLERLAKLAFVLKVERNWLLHGLGADRPGPRSRLRRGALCSRASFHGRRADGGRRA